MFHSMLLTLGYFYEYTTNYDITCEKKIYSKTSAEYTIEFKFKVVGVPFKFNAVYHLPNDSMRFTLKIEKVNKNPNDYNVIETLFSTEQRKIKEAQGLHSLLYKKIVNEALKESERIYSKDMTEGLLKNKLQSNYVHTSINLFSLLQELEKQTTGRVGVKMVIKNSNIIRKRTDFTYELQRETGIVCTKLSFFIEKGMIHKVVASDNYNPRVTLNIDSVKYNKNTDTVKYIRDLSLITTATPLNHLP